MSEIMNKTVLDFLYLTCCALNGYVPNVEKVSQMNLDSLYKLGKAHSMSAIICTALEACNALNSGKADSELSKMWLEDKNKAIRKNLLLDAERQQIIGYLEQNKIWYMPLKGVILKDFYPKTGMRQMSDNDILFDEAFKDNIRSFMLGRGYEQDMDDTSNNFAFRKKPVYNFEMHWSLFTPDFSEACCKYYENVKDRLIKDGGNSYGYHFSDEDFYIYITVHTFKHYDTQGVGFRSLSDCYVYNRKKGGSLDRSYIKNELNKLIDPDFEPQIRALSQKLFCNPEGFYEIKFTEQELEMLGFMANSGTHGNKKNKVIKNLNKLGGDSATDGKTKFRYLMRRLFPDRTWFETYVPFCYRHRWAVPFYCVYRMFNRFFFRRNKLKKEIGILRNAGNSDSESK